MRGDGTRAAAGPARKAGLVVAAGHGGGGEIRQRRRMDRDGIGGLFLFYFFYLINRGGHGNRLNITINHDVSSEAVASVKISVLVV